MAASKPVPTTRWVFLIAKGRHARWRCGLLVIFGFLLLGWLILWTRDELAIRATAQSARALIAAGQFQEAGAPVDRWLKARPKSAEAHFLAARAAIGLERFEQGFAELEAARTLGYPAESVDRQQGIVLSRLGMVNDAEPLLRRVFQAHAGGTSPDPELDEALTRCYLETFQLHAAREVINRWILDAPADARAFYWKADVQRREPEADHDALIALYEHVLELDHDHDKARLALAELYLKAHRNDDSARQYSAYLARHPDDLDALLGLGQISALQGREDESIRLLDRAAKLAPKDFRPLVERGKMEIHLGRLARALEFFDQAVKLDFTEPEVHYQRSLLLTQLGKHDQAMQERTASAQLRKEKEELERLLKDLLNAPGDRQLQLRASRWLFDHGHPEEGQRWAEKILRDEPQNVEANRLLAAHYQKLGNAGLANFYRTQAGGR
jgi:tetratricopeptide (TPR) repeat protein